MLVLVLSGCVGESKAQFGEIPLPTIEPTPEAATDNALAQQIAYGFGAGLGLAQVVESIAAFNEIPIEAGNERTRAVIRVAYKMELAANTLAKLSDKVPANMRAHYDEYLAPLAVQCNKAALMMDTAAFEWTDKNVNGANMAVGVCYNRLAGYRTPEGEKTVFSQ